MMRVAVNVVQVLLLLFFRLVLLDPWTSVVVMACAGGSEPHHHHHDELSDDHHHHHHHRKENNSNYIRTGRNLQDGIDEEEQEEDDEAEERCGFHDPTPEELAQDAERMQAWQRQKEQTSRTFDNGATAGYTTIFLYEIPVAFHILQPNMITNFVSFNRAREYVDYLNDAFAASNAPFVFVLVDITRTINASWGGQCGNSDTEVAYKSALKQGGAETLNVYLCHLIGGTTTGFSYLPFQESDNFVKDGVVLAESLDDRRRLNTLVHETGHWFGLLHTFSGNSCNPNSRGDLVEDTPQHLSRSGEVNCHSNSQSWDTCPFLPGLDPVA